MAHKMAAQIIHKQDNKMFRENQVIFYHLLSLTVTTFSPDLIETLIICANIDSCSPH